jgi:hypothetical protein
MKDKLQKSYHALGDLNLISNQDWKWM